MNTLSCVRSRCLLFLKERCRFSAFRLTSDHAPENIFPCDNDGRSSIERDRSARRTVSALNLHRSEAEKCLVRRSAEVGQKLYPDHVVAAQRPVSEERLLFTHARESEHRYQRSVSPRRAGTRRQPRRAPAIPCLRRTARRSARCDRCAGARSRPEAGVRSVVPTRPET
jgi:hypothetical protein